MNVKTLAVIAACSCLQWTRLTGRVKAINLKDQSVTIQNREGDLLTIPVDYQVKLIEKHDEARDLKHLELDERITLINTPSERIKELNEPDMAQPEKR